MERPIYAFGEILWDCLPSGRHAGGAPFNVTAHLAQLGLPAALISAVGRDDLGDELLQVARDKHVATRFIGQTRIGLPTGTVLASVDPAGNATYELVQPVAWDEITVTPEAQASVAQAGALVFGSLSSRSPYNREQLDRLLALPGLLKCFDVNLRLPFVDPARVLGLAARADVIKLNEDELRSLTSWLQAGGDTPRLPETADAVADACGVLARATGNARICVTLGAAGAVFWDRHASLVRVPAPETVVKDTVGAGDAFMAALVAGLTHGVAPARVLKCACLLGAYVASHAGATPLLPLEMIHEVAAEFHLRS